MALMYSNGFLEVSSLPSKRVVVSYTGNMGSNLKDVQSKFEEIFGMYSFYKLLANSKLSGSPDYLWQAVIEGLDFKRISPAYPA